MESWPERDRRHAFTPACVSEGGRGHKDIHFAIITPDDSLIDESVEPGHKLVFRYCKTVEFWNRESLHLVRTPDGKQYARFIRYVGDRIVLLPANRDYPAVEYDRSEVVIRGVIARVCMAKICDGNSCYEWGKHCQIQPRETVRTLINRPDITLTTAGSRPAAIAKEFECLPVRVRSFAHSYLQVLKRPVAAGISTVVLFGFFFSTYLLIKKNSAEVLTPEALSRAAPSQRSSIVRIDVDKGLATEMPGRAAMEFWPDVSPTDSRLAFQSAARVDSALYSRITIDTGSDLVYIGEGFEPKWSPDGARLAFLRFNENHMDLWVDDLHGNSFPVAHSVVFGGYTAFPVQSPGASDFCWIDRQRIVFSQVTDKVSNLYMAAVDGQTTEITHNTDAEARVSSAVNLDKQGIAYISQRRGWWTIRLINNGSDSILINQPFPVKILGCSNGILIALEPDRDHFKTVAGPIRIGKISDGQFVEIASLENSYLGSIALGPLGKSIAYTADADGLNNIFVLDLQSGRTRNVTLNTTSGVYYAGPQWSSDGKRIFAAVQRGTIKSQQ